MRQLFLSNPLRMAGLAVLAAAGFAGLGACQTMAYYHQAIAGHLDIMSRREPVDDLLGNGDLDPQLRQRLELARRTRDFASAELALPDNDSYRSYVALERDAVTWNVFATPELSLEPRRWCFPVAGCVAYRGYFDRKDADRFAAGLAAEGYDTHVGPATAYSTLGWFDDPLLSTMVRRGEIAMAGVIFHELAHQRLYVDGDTTFNESFAAAVQQAGVHRWLAEQEDAGLQARYAQALVRRDGFLGLVRETRVRLEEVYASDLDEVGKRGRKAQILREMRGRYEAMKARWGGDSRYDAWFSGPINNARLLSVSLYGDRVPDFLHLLEACGGDFEAFYARAAQIGALPGDERATALAEGRCGAAMASDAGQGDPG